MKGQLTLETLLTMLFALVLLMIVMSSASLLLKDNIKFSEKNKNIMLSSKEAVYMSTYWAHMPGTFSFNNSSYDIHAPAHGCWYTVHNNIVKKVHCSNSFSYAIDPRSLYTSGGVQREPW